jgi:hypothetical protein
VKGVIAVSLPVKTLFKLLRVLDIPREAVRSHLGVTPSMISMWSTGTRAMPRRYVNPFLGFVHQAFDARSQEILTQLREATSAYDAQGKEQFQAYETTARQLAEAYRAQPVEALTPEERAAILRHIDEELPRAAPPLPAAQRVEELQARLGHIHTQVERLLEEWKLEISQPELSREVWGVCRGIAQYAEWEFEKFAELLRGPERVALLRLFERGQAALRALDRLHTPPEVEALTQHVQRRKEHDLRQAQAQ